MTKGDIMKLALESGFAKILDEHASEYRNFTFELSQDHYPELGRFIDLVAAHKAEAVIEALREALAQPPLPVQPEPLEYWNAVEGWVKIDEVREHFDSVGCGTIYKHGGEGRVPLYTAPPLMVNGLTEAETSASRSVVGLTKQAEPVAWDKPSASFNAWWDSNYEDPANPFTPDSLAYWAWAGWKAASAQRLWVGLTEQERNDLEDALGTVIGKSSFDNIEAKLKAKNHG